MRSTRTASTSPATCGRCALGRTFDCVFVHDAVTYMLSERDLRQAMETAFVHCNPGGATLFCPDYLRETFKPTEDCGGHDSPTGLRGLRYLDWVWDPDPDDTTYTVDYAYLLRSDDGSIRVEHDRHLEGLFWRADWLRWLEEAGFRPERVPFDHSELEPGRYELFLGQEARVDCRPALHARPPPRLHRPRARHHGVGPARDPAPRRPGRRRHQDRGSRTAAISCATSGPSAAA